MVSKKTKNIFSRLSFIPVFALVTLLLLSCVSCDFQELGISSEKASQTDSEIIKTIISEEMTGEELFLELKSKQIDKNLLRDSNIRKAIFHAIDRQRIVEKLMGEYGGVVDSLFLEESPFYYDAWSTYDYDLAKASEYLGKAGYDKDKPLYLTIGTTNDSESKILVEELIKEDLAKIGINIWFFNKEPKEWYVDYLKNGEFELGIWALYTVDGSNLKNYFSADKIPPMESETNKNCDNFYWYDNKELENLLHGINGDTSEELKVDVMQQVQQELADSAFILPLYRRLFCIAHYDYIKNISIEKSNGNFLKNAYEWKIEKQVLEGEDHGPVTVGYQYEPYTLDPYSRDTSHRDFILSLFSEGLWKMDEYGRYIPNLVEEETALKENDVKALLRTRVMLRDDIFWEGGEKIDSQDIKDTIDYLLSGDTSGIPEKDFGIIEEIKVIDELEFEIVFREYMEGWQELFDFIFPSELISESGLTSYLEDDFYSYGPYKLSEWVKGDHMLLEKNENYGIDFEADQIKILFNSDINYLIGFFKEGDIDILNIPADMGLIEELDSGESSSVIVEQGNLWEHLALSLKPEE